MNRGTFLFGPDLNKQFVYSPEAPPEPEKPLAKPPVAVDLAGFTVEPGKATVKYNLPVYSLDAHAHLFSIVAVALPVTVAKPATPTELWTHPDAVIGEVDVSTMFAGGTVEATITGGKPGESYQGFTLLEFDRPDQPATPAS